MLVLSGAAAAADWEADSVVRQLRDQGYVEFTVSRTLLGRTRVLALAPDGGRREIVFNSATGEILRDYHESATGSRMPTVLDHPDHDADHGGPPMAGEPDDEDGPSRDSDEGSPRANGQDNGPPPHSRGNGPPPREDAVSPPRNREDRPNGSGGGKKDGGSEDEG
jgi:hypothetical protein